VSGGGGGTVESASFFGGVKRRGGGKGFIRVKGVLRRDRCAPGSGGGLYE